MNKKALTTILGVAGGIGVVATGVLAAKGTEKLHSNYTVKEWKEVIRPNLTKKELLKEYLKAYWPTLLAGGATIAANAAGSVINRKTEMSLLAAATLADRGWVKYKNKIKSALGIETHEQIETALSKDDYKGYKSVDGKQTYWEDHVGYFSADPEKLALAFADLNQRLQIEKPGETSYYAMIYNLLKDSDAELFSKDVKPEDLNWGWTNEYLGETYGYVWVHMLYEDVDVEDGGKYTRITFFEDPIFNPGNYGESFFALENAMPMYKKSGKEITNE